MDANNDTPLGFWGVESEEVISRQFPLHKACRDGDVTSLARLVACATPDVLVTEDQFYGWTPIHWAAYFGKVGYVLCSSPRNFLRANSFCQGDVPMFIELQISFFADCRQTRLTPFLLVRSRLIVCMHCCELESA